MTKKKKKEKSKEVKITRLKIQLSVLCFFKKKKISKTISMYLAPLLCNTFSCVQWFPKCGLGIPGVCLGICEGHNIFVILKCCHWHATLFPECTGENFRG